MRKIEIRTRTLILASSLILVGCGGSSSSSTGVESNTSVNDSSSLNGIFMHKNLEWQDNEAVKDGAEFAYRNDYCDALTLGNKYDWRLPSADEFSELHEVVGELEHVWGTDLDIYWTNETTSTHVVTYNLGLGRSGLFILDRVGSTKWGTRCVRDADVEDQ